MTKSRALCAHSQQGCPGAAAFQDGFFPLIHCGTSYGHYKEVRQELIHQPRLREQVRRIMDRFGKPMVFPEEIVHYSEWGHVMRNRIAELQNETSVLLRRVGGVRGR